MKNLFFAFVVILGITACKATYATSTFDSLWNACSNTSDDTVRIMTLLEIGELFENENPDTALYYYDSALSIATKISSNKLKAKCKRYKGYVYKVLLPDAEKAIGFYLDAIKDHELDNDENEIAICYNNIGVIYYNVGEFETAIQYYKKSLAIKEAINDQAGISVCLNNMGLVYHDHAIYDKAIEYYTMSLEIDEALGNMNGVSTSYTNIGVVNTSLGKFDTAIEYFLKALKVYETVAGNQNSREVYEGKKGIASCYNNIGSVHRNQRSFNEAIEFYKRALEVYSELDDQEGLSIGYTNIGICYFMLHDNDRAIEHYQKSLEIDTRAGNKTGMSDCYVNIGNVYYAQNNFSMTTELYLKSLVIKEELGDRNGIAVIYGNLASIEMAMADSASVSQIKKMHIQKAVDYGTKAYAIAKEINSIVSVNRAADKLFRAYKAAGDYERCVQYMEVFMATKDSMFSDEKTKSLAEMSAKYESEKKQLEIEKMQAQKELDNKTMDAQQAENRKQQVIIFSAVIGFVVVLIFSIVILRMFRQKRRANLLLARQNDEILQQKEEITAQRDEIEAQRDQVHDQKIQIEKLYSIAVERKNLVEAQKEEIEDSIHYAKRIQTAVLPSEKYAGSILGDHFIIFRPHSVVSGDFYWATKTDDWTIVTVADCTGHGVPGAFMSMLGVSFLNEIVRKKEVTNAAMVLNQLRASVIDALSQTGEEGTQKDGMDMSIIAVHKDGRRALWAGANNPVYIISNTNKTIEVEHSEIIAIHTGINNMDLIEYKPDKMPVAVHVRMDSFTNHEIELQSGDRIYLFTDGFPDQFGGPNGKKFMYKSFKNLLLETNGLPMSEQKVVMEKALDDWMLSHSERCEQVDDITVLGIKI